MSLVQFIHYTLHRSVAISLVGTVLTLTKQKSLIAEWGNPHIYQTSNPFLFLHYHLFPLKTPVNCE